MKLHELLAIETNLENQANKTRMDLANTFEKKRHHFEEKRVVFQPLAEGEPSSVEAQSDLQTTVRRELNWLSGYLIQALDAGYQVSESNMKARADIVLEDDAGTILAKDVPATALLELEKRVAELHTLLAGIPTLDPAKGFTPDDQRGQGVYKAREVVKTRTKKDVKVVVRYEATKEHPAQTELVNVDVPVGKLQEQEWSGLISPAEKAQLLDRVEKLARAVRRARSRANEVEVDTAKKLGKGLLDYVLGA
jgi:hypothetical protein